MPQTLVPGIRFTLFFILLFFSGCGKHHQVFINPALPIHDSKIGDNISISLYVEDRRSSNIIAKWKKGLRKFSISSQNDLKDIFSIKMQQGLIKLGFVPKIHRRNPNHSLKVDILSIRSRYSESVPRMSIKVMSQLRATCNNKAKKYAKTYSAKISRRNITPATFPNENLINASLSKIMRQILTDKSLIGCLIN